MHINMVHRIHKCTDCDKRFVTEEGRDNHRADVHQHPRFHCKVKRCGVYAHNQEELHRHMRNKHWSKFPFRCTLCPYVLETRESFERHLEKMHNIPASKDDSSVVYKCTKCVREYRSVSMFINHSREHSENIHSAKSVIGVLQCWTDYTSTASQPTTRCTMRVTPVVQISRTTMTCTST